MTPGVSLIRRGSLRSFENEREKKRERESKRERKRKRKKEREAEREEKRKREGEEEHQKITLVYICRINMRLYIIKSLNDIYMSNNF